MFPVRLAFNGFRQVRDDGFFDADGDFVFVFTGGRGNRVVFFGTGFFDRKSDEYFAFDFNSATALKRISKTS